MNAEIYTVRCWNCLNDFEAVEAVWCSCDPKHPTKLCPFCLHCFCPADDEYKRRAKTGETLVAQGLVTRSSIRRALRRARLRAVAGAKSSPLGPGLRDKARRVRALTR